MGRLTTTLIVLVGRRWYSSVLDVRSFRGAGCDTVHYLVVAYVRERFAVNKQAAQKLDGERFNLRKLNELEVSKHYHIEISKRFAALENVIDGEDINRVWESIKENIKTSAKESLGMHERTQCLGFLDQRRQAKKQWVQNPSQSNVDSLNNVGREASRHFRKTKKDYLKAKIDELEINSNIKNIKDLYRDIKILRRVTGLRLIK